MLIVAWQASVAVASGPGVDEYNLHIPGAGNSDNHPTPGNVESDPSALPPATADGLSGTPDGALLGAIATSPELGAPSHHGGNGQGDEGAGASGDTHGIGPALSQLAAGNDGRSVPSSLASAAGDQSSLPLILAVAAITAIAAGFVVRRRRSILDG
jgi:hypothetical protein